MNMRGQAEALVRDLIDVTTITRDEQVRRLTSALCDAYDAGRTIERERVRGQLLRSAGLS